MHLAGYSPGTDNTLSQRRGRRVGWKSWDKPWPQSFENGREGRMWREEMCSNTTGSSPRSWVKQSTRGQGSLRWRESCVCNPRPIQYRAAWSSTREARLAMRQVKFWTQASCNCSARSNLILLVSNNQTKVARISGPELGVSFRVRIRALSLSLYCSSLCCQTYSVEEVYRGRIPRQSFHT